MEENVLLFCFIQGVDLLLYRHKTLLHQMSCCFSLVFQSKCFDFPIPDPLSKVVNLSVDIVRYPHHVPAPIVHSVAHHTDQLAHLLGELSQGVKQTDNNCASQTRILLITLRVSDIFSSQICGVVLQICKTRLKTLNGISYPLSDASDGIKQTYDGILGLGEIPPFLKVLCMVV